jgi:hypothetical protein
MLLNLSKSSYGDCHFSYITRLKNKNPGAMVANIPKKILIKLTTLFQGTLETLASRHKGYNTLPTTPPPPKTIFYCLLGNFK